MDKTEVLKGLSLIDVAYGTLPKNTLGEMVELWHSFLKPYNGTEYYEAIREHMTESKYRPQISEIMQKLNKKNKLIMSYESDDKDPSEWTPEEYKQFNIVVDRLRELEKMKY